jgi:hypothetical protein
MPFTLISSGSRSRLEVLQPRRRCSNRTVESGRHATEFPANSDRSFASNLRGSSWRVEGEIMHSILGIFESRTTAEKAVQGLLATPISPQSIIFLSGEAGKAQVDSLPTTATERDGMGEAVGGLVGGAVGAGTGLSLGSAIASLFVPGVGTIFAIGLGAAALLGIGGAAAGVSAGEASEHAADTGVPKDDTLVYHELLKRGRSLVIANVDDDDLASAAKAVFHRLGAEDVAEARKNLEPAA